MKRDAQFRVSRPSLKLVVQIAVSAVVLFVAVAFCFHPGVVTLRVATDPELRSAGRPRLLRQWFEDTAGRYNRWATRYLASQRAHAVSELDVTDTEWHNFG